MKMVVVVVVAVVVRDHVRVGAADSPVLIVELEALAV